MWNGTGKVAFVTGGTSGIGKAIGAGLAESGAAVTLLARDPKRAAVTIDEIKAKVPGARVDFIEGDLSIQASVEAVAKRFTSKHPRLDILVNCAGVFLPTRTVTPDGIETTFAANYLGHFQLTNLLLPALKAASPSRVVTVASRYGGAKIDFGDLMVETRKFSYIKAVPPTKLAEVLFTQELAERLQGTGVVANCLHPGLVANTRLLNETRGFFRWLTNRLGGSPEKGADTALWLALAPETEKVTGKMWSKRKPMKTPGQGSDPAARKRLWAESERLLVRPKRVVAKPTA